MTQRFMVIIDDLELEESQVVANFLKDAIEAGDLELAIQDCISITNEIKFHKFEAGDLATWKCVFRQNGQRCMKHEIDTIHQAQFEETE